MLHARIPRASKLTAHAVRHSAATLALLLAAGGSAVADCKCRAGGRDYQHGARVCLSGSTGPRTAVCGMDQNVASWIFLDEPCAVSARPAALRVAAHLPPLR
ncbi:hypothetical protein [Ancylobacter defluvii]|uniref:Secreted protein n=1 Tax=Ancylobacter defluvii TaxID=1282440 RepID=A0A9W6K3Y5_9HYPH|nr:hypothetical protein [Ancylobacter defluvii]MBS7588151.1 hypothetical protein [Ancylobacter defluvii]GLK86543.1 hypothetical protein GCM10017653_46130 [Ancylobacter defluvii]